MKKNRVFILFILCFCYLLLCPSLKTDLSINKDLFIIPADTSGKYFAKKKYIPSTLPKYNDIKSRLPKPVYDENPIYIEMYYKAWEIACNNFYEPNPGSGYVSQFIDAAFNQNIFLWDTGFMTMFCNYAYPLVPGISSLDNFYIKQHSNGEICREINRNTGIDFKEWINKEKLPLFSRWGYGGYPPRGEHPVKYIGRVKPDQNPFLTLDAMNHPILAWAELESYYITGNKDRLNMVWLPLYHYYFSLKEYIQQGNKLFITDWASMDNSPRNQYLKDGGMGIDISAEMVLFANNLSEIAVILLKKKEREIFTGEAKEISEAINKYMWDPGKKFYFDLQIDETRVSVKTIAAYWALLAGVAPKDRAEVLVNELTNPKTFGRLHPVPTCSADETGYESAGGYWRGAVWAPTNTMVIRGLERYGYSKLAKEIALKHLDVISKVYKETGTIWENYSPDTIMPGKVDNNYVKKDFVGWSGIGPIMYFIKYAIGIDMDARINTITWNISSDKKSGCENIYFNNNIISLLAEPGKNSEKTLISVSGNKDFKLIVKYGKTENKYKIKKGSRKILI